MLQNDKAYKAFVMLLNRILAWCYFFSFILWLQLNNSYGSLAIYRVKTEITTKLQT